MLQGIERLVDLAGVSASGTGNTKPTELHSAIQNADIQYLQITKGHFAGVARQGHTVRLARTIGIPLRYFVAKMFHGPFLIAADRIDTLFQWCCEQKIGWQFDPAYTRMVPAHYLLEIDQIGCPDPAPRHFRFFNNPVETADANIQSCGTTYISAAMHSLQQWITEVPEGEQIGIAFSGGIDSTSVWLLARYVMSAEGRNPDNIRAFTLDLGGGKDAAQAEVIAKELGLEHTWERITASPDSVNMHEAIEVIEDYHPLDVQCSAVALTLLKGIRERYPNLKYLLDGDGGDENLKDYPLEDSDLTLSSVLRNPLLYQEGWGVDAIKHSLTYSGGLSRSYVRTYAPARKYGFTAFSPYTTRECIAAATDIPYTTICNGSIERLYTLKGDIVKEGTKHVLGIEIPTPPKRRFQDGAGGEVYKTWRISKSWCRQVYLSQWEERLKTAWDTDAEKVSGNDLNIPLPTYSL